MLQLIIILISQIPLNVLPRAHLFDMYNLGSKPTFITCKRGCFCVIARILESLRHFK